MEPVIIDNITINPDRAEVVRLLGKKRDSGESFSDRVEEALEEAMSEAARLIRPAGIYLITAGKDLPRSTIFDDLEKVAFCICTIGPMLEDLVSELSKTGELLKAVILDSVGSVCAEETANHIDRLIAAKAAGEGLKTSCRASPGYGDWDIKEQRSIFDLLDGGKIGVRLSESSMMIPRKSVSFAIDIAERPARMRSENSCRNCDMDRCFYRRDK
ncbi:MAG: hypothetical protein JW814_05105 [Candidatus Krumholzibacteriota bacterium]|nr:hypothetical protein [Candidatus Krumholzibacteriota bacterium]